jgi:iron complex outermembrane recepter protein
MKNYLLTTLLLFITTIVFSQTGSINGYLKTSDGNSANFITVKLLELNKTASSNANGYFEFKNIKSGSYNLQVTTLGLQSKKITVNVISNKTTTVSEIILDENTQTLNEVVIESRKKYTKEPQTIANRLGIRDIENPQSVQVISQEVMRDKQIQTVGEAIKSMAGVNSFSASQYSDYVMRGFRSAPGNFTYNGIKGDFYQFDQATLTYNLESIEAIKGPASVLFSAGNPGGIINHVTKKAQAAPRYELNYTFGSFDQHRVLADATGAISNDKKLIYRFIVGYENTGQLDKNLKIKNLFVAPQIQYNFNDKTSINYELNYANDNRTMGVNRGVPASFDPNTKEWTLDRFPITTSLVDPNGQAVRNTVSNQLTFKHNFAEDLKLTVLYRGVLSKTFQGDLLSPDAFSTGATLDEIPLQNSYWNEDLHNHQLSSFLNIKLAKDNFVSHNIAVGLDANIGGKTAEYAGFETRIVKVDNPEFGWGFYTQSDFDANMATAEYQSGWREQTRYLAGYVQDQISIGEKFKLLLGGRFESHKFNIDNYDLVTEASTSKDSLYANQFLPRVGLVFNPNKTTAVYYSYAQGFQPQYGSNGGQGGPFAPEKSRQHELGFKKEWFNHRLITTVALYEIQKFDVLAQDPNDSNGLRLIQIDNVFSKGIEFSAQGKVTNNFDLILNYTYNEARTPGDSGFDGYPAGWFPNAPNTNVNFWGKYTFENGMLKNVGIGAGCNYLGKRSTYIPEFEVPEYTTFDAAISYKLKNYSINANVFNLTNVRYYNGAYSPANLWPGNPLSFRLSVGYVF